MTGTLTASPNTTYQIQFFANPAADPSGFGQGQTYLATKTVTTNGSGVASFTFTIKPALAAGEVISATATSPLDNTSAFSADVTVTSAPTAPAVKATVAIAPAALAAPATTAVTELTALPAVSSTPDDAVVTALAVDQVHARKQRGAAQLPHALAHAVKIKTSNPHSALIRVHPRTVAVTSPVKPELVSSNRTRSVSRSF